MPAKSLISAELPEMWDGTFSSAFPLLKIRCSVQINSNGWMPIANAALGNVGNFKVITKRFVGDYPQELCESLFMFG